MSVQISLNLSLNQLNGLKVAMNKAISAELNPSTKDYFVAVRNALEGSGSWPTEVVP